MTTPQPSETPEAADLEVTAEQACVAFRRCQPDDEPRVTIRTAYRNISCSGSGPECYRRLLFGPSATPEWPDERLPRLGFRAPERRATVYEEVPIGTVVLAYERQRYRGRGGKCSFTAGIVGRAPCGDAKIHWLAHRTLRKRPVYEISLPDGTKLEVERRS